MMKGAERYAQFRAGAPGASLRDELALDAAAPAELELQARWFAGDFGRDFRTTDGRPVRVIQFGVWNREAGPDFAEAAISLAHGPTRRGGIELDPEAADWERHGHATNPAYEGVILHVSFRQGAADFFCRTASNREVPRVLLDLAAFHGPPPRAVPLAVPGRCVAPLRDLDAATLRDLLEAAAQFRLRRKAERLARLREAHGADEALYQALAETLGYKSNKLPFTVLSQRAPLSVLLPQKDRAEALLFGVAGFLRPEDFHEAEKVTRAYLRDLWRNWWALRAEWEPLRIDPALWKTGRPVNHPQRRVAALAALVRNWPKVRGAAAAVPAAIRELLTGFANEYWNRHYTIQSAPAKTAMALIGDSRVTEMLANVFIPWNLPAQPEQWERYLALPAALGNRRLETAVVRLFGAETRPVALLKSAAIQQGLLQIYEDFCMRDQTDCAECPFPRKVAQWRG